MTVDKAVVTVTVTGAQVPVSDEPADPEAAGAWDTPAAPLVAAADDPAAPDAGTTVMYLVEVLVPVMVVVGWTSSPETPEVAAADSLVA